MHRTPKYGMLMSPLLNEASLDNKIIKLYFLYIEDLTDKIDNNYVPWHIDKIKIMSPNTISNGYFI